MVQVECRWTDGGTRQRSFERSFDSCKEGLRDAVVHRRRLCRLLGSVSLRIRSELRQTGSCDRQRILSRFLDDVCQLDAESVSLRVQLLRHTRLCYTDDYV